MRVKTEDGEAWIARNMAGKIVMGVSGRNGTANTYLSPDQLAQFMKGCIDQIDFGCA